MRAAFFNCVGGASGDMILGAMVDAGLPMDRLARELKKLNVEGFSISVEPAKRGGVDGTHVTVHIAESAPRQKHWRDFVKMVDGSSLSASLKQKAVRVFERLGKAEAAVHKGPVDSVHLHELASLDTLVDVCGAVVGMELLGVGSVYASPLPAGSGVFTIEHGVMPGLSPATAALVADAKAPLGPPPAGVADSGETVTPTGAAILTTLATFSQPVMRVERVGYGLGRRNHPKYPNVLALWLGEAAAVSGTGEMVLLETNLDDITAEVLGYVQERLFALGARDVWFTPIQMKKGRPGTKLSALVAAGQEAAAVALVLRETTTLGVRATPVRRHEAEREQVSVETSLGAVAVKVKRLQGRAVSVSPEYESCRKIALERGMPLQEVMRIVQREADDALLKRQDSPGP